MRHHRLRNYLRLVVGHGIEHRIRDRFRFLSQQLRRFRRLWLQLERRKHPVLQLQRHHFAELPSIPDPWRIARLSFVQCHWRGQRFQHHRHNRLGLHGRQLHLKIVNVGPRYRV
jgi:hypothetical protein